MASYSSYADINKLGEFILIGGTDFTMTFRVFDAETGSPANLSAATCSWKMCPTGKENIVILSKTGTVSGDFTYFTVHLTADDTLYLNGTFEHQPLVVDGSTPYRSQQGTIHITPAIN